MHKQIIGFFLNSALPCLVLSFPHGKVKPSIGFTMQSNNLHTPHTNNFTLPETGYIRIWHIIGDPKAEPPRPPIVPVSRSTWLSWVKEGKAPEPIKLSERTTAWRVEDIREFLRCMNETDYMPLQGIGKKRKGA